MAIFNAAEAFDIRTVDLNWYNRNYTGVNLLTNSTHIFLGTGTVYPQVFIFHGDDSFAQRDWVVGGTGMTVDATGTVNAGTVTGMYEEHNPSGTVIDSYSLEGFSLSAVTVINATLSEDNTDDIAVFAAALSGNDAITLSNFKDNMRGYGGNDTISGKGGSDTIYGDDGNDTISGGTGNDVLMGGLGNDIVKGDAGLDILLGGAGLDRLTGGADKDVFDYNAIAESVVGSTRDKIFDFVSGTDKIDLASIDANSATLNNNAFAFAGTAATPHSVWYVVADADGDTVADDIIVRGDVDGNTTADFEIGLLNIASVSASDFAL